MPLRLARHYAIMHQRVPSAATLDWLLAEGIRGGSYWEVMAALRPGVRCLNQVKRDDVDWFWDRSLARPAQTPSRMKIKRMLRAIHAAVARGHLSAPENSGRGFLARPKPVFGEEKRMNLNRFWAVIWKRMWMIVLLFAVTMIVILFGALSAKPVYEAAVRLQVIPMESEQVGLYGRCGAIPARIR